MSRDLPDRPSLEHLKKQAKELLSDFRNGEPEAVRLLRPVAEAGGGAEPKLADAQHALAREYGFANWAKLKSYVESMSSEPMRELVAAIQANSAAQTSDVLQRHPGLKSKLDDPVPDFSFGGTPLLAAVHLRNRDLVDVLLKAGADVNVRSHWWAGSFGVLDGNDDLVPFLIDRGATVDAYAAARHGMVERLEALVAKDPACVNMRGGDGQTPLHVAKDERVARFLVEHGAGIDTRDVDHEATPAQYAVRDRQDVSRYLVSLGCHTDILMAAALGDVDLARRHLDADPDCVRMSVSEKWFPKQNPRAGGHIYIWTLGWNKTPQMVAREFGHEDVFRLLMERTPEDLKLAQALELGDEELFKTLLARRPGLLNNLTDDDRRKLVDAAQNNNTRAVRLMLDAGWPVGARGQHGGTALHWAAWHGNAEMLREILRHHPAIEDRRNDFNATPLGWATHGSVHGWHGRTGDYAGAAEALLAAGAKPPAPVDKVEASEAVLEVLRRHAGPSGEGEAHGEPR